MNSKVCYNVEGGMQMGILRELFLTFLKIGAFTFGGGYAMIALLENEFVSEKKWMTKEDFLDMVAIAESTPGPIGVNMATYVGFITGGIPGALIATLGLITPSIIIILIVANLLKAFRDSKYVNAAFYGLRPASTAMVAAAGIDVVLLALLDTSASGLAMFRWREIALAAVILVLTRWTPKVRDFHPIVFIALGAIVGILLKF